MTADGRNTRWARHWEERSRLIVDAAIGLLDEGNPAPSMQEIAQAAGVPRSVVYRLFVSRENLNERIRLRIIELLRDELSPRLVPAETIRALIRDATTAFVTWVAAHPTLYYFLDAASGSAASGQAPLGSAASVSAAPGSATGSAASGSAVPGPATGSAAPGSAVHERSVSGTGAAAGMPVNSALDQVNQWIAASVSEISAAAIRAVSHRSPALLSVENAAAYLANALVGTFDAVVRHVIGGGADAGSLDGAVAYLSEAAAGLVEATARCAGVPVNLDAPWHLG